jgi:hypothetical protein
VSNDYFDIRAWLEAETEQAEATKGQPWGIPTTYAGTNFRSRLEASWAGTLDRYGIRWDYEPHMYQLSNSRQYLPDFSLPDLSTFIEVKGPHMQRLDKARELAERMAPEALVLIGYPPQYRHLTEWSGALLMQWASPLDVMTAFTVCTQCRAYQWCAPRYSMDCRACGRPLDGHFAGCGEMRFEQWQGDNDIPPELMALLKGGAA